MRALNLLERIDVLRQDAHFLHQKGISNYQKPKVAIIEDSAPYRKIDECLTGIKKNTLRLVGIDNFAESEFDFMMPRIVTVDKSGKTNKESVRVEANALFNKIDALRNEMIKFRWKVVHPGDKQFSFFESNTFELFFDCLDAAKEAVNNLA